VSVQSGSAELAAGAVLNGPMTQSVPVGPVQLSVNR
jgi:hypothetical protein